MSKYLSLDAIKQHIAFLRENGVASLDLQEVEEAMEYAVPAAEVAPVVHAQWEKISEPDEDVWYRCPICQHNDKQSPGIDVPHCWYCGARMDRNG